jgi:hypothetical protein
MDELYWPLLWALAGLPIILAGVKYKLSRKAPRDYGHYLEWKLFSTFRLGVTKLALFVSVGLILTVLSLSFERMVSVISIAAVCGVLVESTALIGRPHPTPEYVPGDPACIGCRSNAHDSCTNVRMLDSFENNFLSKEGTKRPLCCCGFRISVVRPLSA